MAFLLVAAGGAIGSMLRYAVAVAFAGASFPYATLIVNVAGCLLIGLALPVAERVPLLSHDLRLLLVVGLLGGFTTFSTFGHETVALIHLHHTGRAVVNVCLSVLLGLGAVACGRALGSRLFG